MQSASPTPAIQNEMRKSASLATSPYLNGTRYSFGLVPSASCSGKWASGAAVAKPHCWDRPIAKRQRLRRASLNARGQLTGCKLVLRQKSHLSAVFVTGWKSARGTDRRRCSTDNRRRDPINIDNPTGSVAKRRTGRADVTHGA